MLEQKIRERLRKKRILLMTHTVLGYPSLEASLGLIGVLAESGADLLELQIPFSDPIADGPVIVRANEQAIRMGAPLTDCLEIVKAACSLSIPVVVMTYYNVEYCYGIERFIRDLSDMGVEGLLVPDLPPEEGGRHLCAAMDRGLSPVLTLSPTTPMERLERITSLAQGFLYCVSRRGVTGSPTQFAWQLASYLAQCRRMSELPLAVGFGVSGREDVAFLEEKAEIAVIGTELLKRLERGGPEGVGRFVRGLCRPGSGDA